MDVIGVGVLGCGPIAQAGHLDAVRKARGVHLQAVCDVAADLRERMTAIHQPVVSYADYDQMLADPEVGIVIVATADAFHAALAVRALEAGRHVLVEKPFATTVADARMLAETARRTGRMLRVGHNKRFDGGIVSARDFVKDEMGEMLALRAWYCDSTHRYTNTDALQPILVRSSAARTPAHDPKADKARYFLMAHGSHLIDLARFLAGDIVAVRARLVERFGAYSWFVEAEFASGCNAHLDLTVAVRMDWHEGFHIYGEFGSVVAKTYNPWYHRSSEVDIFRERDAVWSRALAADGQTYRRQIEGLARDVAAGVPCSGGADERDGLACIQTMRAIQMSVASGGQVALADAEGAL